MVNTYLLWDETGEAVLVDAACHDPSEQEEITSFLEEKQLKLVRNINTHCHVDHVLGNGFIAERFGVHPEYHADSVDFFESIREIGMSFGFSLDVIPEVSQYLKDQDVIRWGGSLLRVLHTPGHAAGSLCFYNDIEGFVITGDVLFKDTIGRTDLPSGDFDLLMKSIKTRLFTLPPDTVVYPGHGPETTIGYEMANNPFIR